VAELVDAHVHLNQYPLPEACRVVDEARAAGVTTLLTAGVDLPTSQRDVDSLSALGHHIRVLVGIHPWWADSYAATTAEALARLAREPRVVGFGEIGLDFVRGTHPEAIQTRAFEGMLDLAEQLCYPVLIHGDRLDERTHAAAQAAVRRRGGRVGGAVHGFAAGRETASGWLDLGFALSFSGVLTWDERDDLRATAAAVPLDRLLIETDTPAPYPPQRARGEANHPRHAAELTAALARLRGLDAADAAALVAANVRRVFPRVAG
jgi:TatD DNase family protein